MDIIETLFTLFFTDKFDAVNHAIQTWDKELELVGVWSHDFCYYDVQNS